VVGPYELSRFDDAIALEGSGSDTVRGSLDPQWWGGAGPHGGYLAAIIVRSSLTKADNRRKLRSVTIHYLAAAQEGAIDVECVVVRQTRTSTTVRLPLVQDGAPIVVALATMLAGRVRPELSDAVIPDVPDAGATPIGQFEFRRRLSDFALAFSKELAYRPRIGPEPLTAGEEAIAGGWVRLRDQRPLDEPAAAVLVDGWWSGRVVTAVAVATFPNGGPDDPFPSAAARDELSRARDVPLQPPGGHR
jgi:hypothetical protein